MYIVTLKMLQTLQAHPALKPESRLSRLEGYVKGGRKLASWTMWVALETYLQVSNLKVTRYTTGCHTHTW